MPILLLDFYFKIKSKIYMGILGVLIKKFSISNFILSNSSQFLGKLLGTPEVP